MPDVFTKAKRSDVMSRIRSQGNKDTELALVRLFRAHKISGWRRQLQVRIAERGTRNSFRTPRSALRVFTVTPDFVFFKQRVTVFVDGCFWHGCPKHGTKPANNRAFWRRKFSRNKQRDALVNRTLRRAGWRVLRVWEHELRQSRKRKAGKRKGGGQTTGRGNIQPSTFNLQPRTAVVWRIQRAIAGRSE